MIGILAVATYATVSACATIKRKESEEKKLLAGSFAVDKSWLVQFAKSSSSKFLLGGSLALITYWSGQDWGAYTTLVVMALDIVREKLEEI